MAHRLSTKSLTPSKMVKIAANRICQLEHGKVQIRYPDAVQLINALARDIANGGDANTDLSMAINTKALELCNKDRRKRVK